MDNVELVNLAISGDAEGFAAAFNNAMAAKVTDALEIKKVEIASNLLGSEEADEVTDTSIEADGTDDAAGSEESSAESEPTTEDPANAE